MPPHICLFGGSFDPIHAGHMQLARAAQECCQLDELIFLPAACSPFKMEHEPFLTDAQRLELLQEATRDLPWAQVSDLDLKLPPPSYSCRLVEHWLQLKPDAELYWLMGVDQWRQLEHWSRYDYLVEHLHFIVHYRDGEAPTPKEGVRATFIAGHHPASSSAIRAMLSEGKAVPKNWEAFNQVRSEE